MSVFGLVNGFDGHLMIFINISISAAHMPLVPSMSCSVHFVLDRAAHQTLHLLSASSWRTHPPIVTRVERMHHQSGQRYTGFQQAGVDRSHPQLGYSHCQWLCCQWILLSVGGACGSGGAGCSRPSRSHQ